MLFLDIPLLSKMTSFPSISLHKADRDEKYVSFSKSRWFQGVFNRFVASEASVDRFQTRRM